MNEWVKDCMYCGALVLAVCALVGAMAFTTRYELRVHDGMSVRMDNWTGEICTYENDKGTSQRCMLGGIEYEKWAVKDKARERCRLLRLDALGLEIPLPPECEYSYKR